MHGMINLLSALGYYWISVCKLGKNLKISGGLRIVAVCSRFANFHQYKCWQW